jgi:hypothetical protein
LRGVVFIYVYTFRQNITRCKFGNNSGADGNDIYFGGSDYPAGRIRNSCSSSEAVKIYSPSAYYDLYLPACAIIYLNPNGSDSESCRSEVTPCQSWDGAEAAGGGFMFVVVI